MLHASKAWFSLLLERNKNNMLWKPLQVFLDAAHLT